MRVTRFGVWRPENTQEAGSGGWCRLETSASGAGDRRAWRTEIPQEHAAASQETPRASQDLGQDWVLGVQPETHKHLGTTTLDPTPWVPRKTYTYIHTYENGQHLNTPQNFFRNTGKIKKNKENNIHFKKKKERRILQDGSESSGLSLQGFWPPPLLSEGIREERRRKRHLGSWGRSSWTVFAGHE